MSRDRDMQAERAAFEEWYTQNAFDLERNPIGSRECGLQWMAWRDRALVATCPSAPSPTVAGLTLTGDEARAIVRAAHPGGSDHPTGIDYVRATVEYLDRRDAGSSDGLKVFYGPMPESNGKSNFTAILYRDRGNDVLDIVDGVTLDRSEFPDRVRYEADRARFMIGELAERPDILDYDADKHSGYVERAPADSAETRDGWKLVPVEPTEAMAKAYLNPSMASWRQRYIAMLAAVPAKGPKCTRCEYIGKCDCMPAQGSDARDDSAILDWLIHNVSGKALRDIAVITSAGCDRAAIRVAMSREQAGKPKGGE